MGLGERAQLFGGQPTTTKPYRQCTPYKLPSAGVIEIAPDYTVTLTADAIFTPQCAEPAMTQIDGDDSGVTSITDMKDPFHASITPQAYATGAATVIAWMLVIMLIITPRTFFVGGASGRSGLMGRRGMIGGASGGGSIIGVGTRPWLQKVAALTVAVSLTLATADTFRIAERQYNEGFTDAMTLRDEVVSGMEIKVSRVISDVFLWLAQVQTLIRLFPRHKEKVIIKWAGFALILLDIAFSCLNSFGPYNDHHRPARFEAAIPALSYLFQLSLSMLYAAWVMYYAVTKRRYAFYHSMMWNISLVALLSIVAILTPVVFFITDISNYTIAGWGDYFRWVGAAAASVIVWEWVERIEALEREERKGGILGREIYDGDEMLETTPSHEVWPRQQRQNYTSEGLKKPGDGDGSRGGAVFTTGAGHSISNLAHRLGRSRHEQVTESHMPKSSIHIPAPIPAARRSESSQHSRRSSRTYLPLQNSPVVPVIASPVSRTDTTSADSTVYTIRYHPISISPAVAHSAPPTNLGSRRTPSNGGIQTTRDQETHHDPEKAAEVKEDDNTAQSKGRFKWQAVANPFRRRGRSPPPEIQRGRVIEPLVVDDVSTNIPPRNYTGLALKDRLGTFAAHQGERFRSKKKTGEEPELNLPVTIIPAQPRGRTWSPDLLLQQQQQQEDSLGEEQTRTQSEVSATTGLHFQRDSPRSVPASSTPRAHVTQDAMESGQEASGSSCNRTSHVRFAPEVFQRPTAGQRANSWSRTPPQAQVSVALGTETRDFQPQPSTSPQPSLGRSITSESSTEQHHTPTNHDR